MNNIVFKGQEYKCVQIKNDYEFNKIFSVALRDFLSKNKISVASTHFLFCSLPYISFPLNTLVINGKNPNLDSLKKLLGFKKTSIYKIFKELESLFLIKKIKLNGCTIIYFNPFLICSGGIVAEETYQLFKESEYNIINKDTKKGFYSKYSIAVDETECQSESEMIIHNYLLNLNIEDFEKDVPYKSFISNKILHKLCGLKRADWTIKYDNKIYIIEYFGLMNKVKYRQTHKEKLEIISLDNKDDNFIKIYPKDIDKLEEIFSFIK